MQDPLPKVMDHNQQVADVLQLVVQHCPDLSNRCKDVCNLLRLNRACRTAVQQSVGLLEVEFSVDGAAGLDRLAAFSAWFAKNASLVSSLLLRPGAAATAAAQQLLLFALQSAAIAPLLALAASQYAAAGDHILSMQPQLVQQQATPTALQLQSCDIGATVSASLLDALAASTRLTQLNLHVSRASVTPCWRESLGRLTGLRSLDLAVRSSGNETPYVFPEGCLQALNCLTQVSKLSILRADLAPEQYQLLPPSLQQLKLEGSANAGVTAVAPQPGTASLQHLSRLHTLRVDTLPPGCVLPPSLTYLGFGAQALHFEGGQGLKSLSLSGASTSTHLWDQLPSITALRTLTVGLLAKCSPEALQQCFASASAATQLRSLSLLSEALPPNGWQISGMVKRSTMTACPLGGVQLHQHMQKLGGLESLRIAGLEIQPADAVHLTFLTGLTDLELAHCTSIGDLAAVGMACRLTGLQHLALVRCGLTSPTLWPALANLTGLEFLGVVRPTPELTDDSLHLLAPLTNLTVLIVDKEAFKVSKSVASKFLQGMPLLKRIAT